jgi:energy-coupling factor transporter ATP-binding protein EcfA2
MRVMFLFTIHTTFMHISKIKIENILGIEHLEINAGQVTTISGRNASGKTSVLESIKAALKGGHDATLLRNGAEEGEIVLVLSDDTQITKTVTATDSKTTVKRHGRNVQRASSVIDSLRDLISINPVAFIQAEEKKRTEILLKAMPIELDIVRINAIVEPTKVQTALTPVAGSELSFIDGLRAAVFAERTNVNRSAKDKWSSVRELEGTLPKAAARTAKEVQEDINECVAEMEDVQTRLAAHIDTLMNERSTIKTGAESYRNQLMTEAMTRRDEAIAAAHAAYHEATQVIGKDYEDEIARGTAIFNEKSNDARAKAEQYLAPIRTTHSQLTAQLTVTAGAAKQREIFDRYKQEAAELDDHVTTLSVALNKIDEYKLELLEQVPIKGLEIRDGSIYLDGVPFDRLNTATKVRVSLAVSRLRAGELNMMCVDGIESLDEETFNALVAAALSTDLQFFFSRVEDHDFTINTLG